MRYLIGILAFIVFLILGSSAAYCGYRAITDELSWGFVMVGLMLPTALALLIAQAGFSAAREY